MNNKKLVISPPQTDGRSKKRPGVEEQKIKLLDAAISLFTAHGTKFVSISQICKQAELTRPTFYRCFEDKEGLIYELYQNTVNQAVEDSLLKHLQKDGDDTLWLQAAINDVFEAIFSQARLADLLFRESNDPTSPAYTIIESAFENAAQLLLKKLNITKNKAMFIIYFKSIMSAHQWIIHNAIITGVTTQSKRQAKQASWLLISKLFTT